MTEPVPYQCFISYTRSDNDDYDGVVDRLKREIAGRFEADTGSRLEFFLDRESIGWGERWREKIADAIAGSILFMPIVTMRYFNSPNCRDELSAFHSAAIQRGVPDLILPVVLAGSDQITSEHPDELVRAVAELNWQPISKEFEAGYESAFWKGRIGALVSGFRQALTRAANQLSNQAPPVQSPNLAAEDTERTEERTQFTEMTSDISDLRPIVEKIASARSSRLADRDPAQMTTGQRTFLFGALADDLREPAETFRSRASAIESKAGRLDAELRALIAEMHLLTPQDIQRQLAGLQGPSQKGLEDAQQIFDQMDQLEKGLRMAALVSVKLRAALRPISAGLQSMSTTLKIIISWQSIELPRTLRRFMTSGQPPAMAATIR